MVKISFMKTSITVVDARAYSFASGEVSDEIETATSPSTSSGQLAQALLVGMVDVGVEQADRDALDVAAREDRQLLRGLLLVERHELAPVGQDPLRHPPAQVAGNERSSGVPERAPPGRIGQAVERPPHATTVEHVAVALGRQEGDLRQAARDHRVQAHRARVVEDRLPLDAETPRALDNRPRRLGAIARHLRHLDPAVPDRDDIREGPADVDPEHVRRSGSAVI